MNTPPVTRLPSPRRFAPLGRTMPAGLCFLVMTFLSAPGAQGANGTWTNLAGGSWAATTNWLSGTIADGIDATANFATLNITAARTVTLDGARTIGGLQFGDATTADNNWVLNTGTGDPLTLQVTTGIPVVSVTNQTATINLQLAGTQGLLKTGAGTLVLSFSGNSYGDTILSAGTLSFGNDGALGYSYNLVVTNGTLQVTGTSVNSLANHVVNWTTFNGTLDINANNNVLSVSDNLGGAGRLTKAGAGILALQGNNAGMTGSPTVNGGSLVFSSPSAIPGTGASLTVNAGAAAAFDYAGLQTDLARVVPSSAGSVAVTVNSAADNVNFQAASLSNAFFGAVGTVDYAGLFTPYSTTYRLGGGNGLLIFTNLAGANSLIVGAPPTGGAGYGVSLPTSNSFTAGTTLIGDTGIGDDSALGTGSVALGQAANGPQFWFYALNGPRAISNAISLRATRFIVANGNFAGQAGSDLTFNGPVTLDHGNQNVHDIYLQRNLTINGAITNGSGTQLVLQGGSTLTLTASNSYTGGTFLNGTATLSITNDNNIGGPTSALTFGGGSLQVGGTSLSNLSTHVVNWSSFNGALDIADAANVFTVASAITSTTSGLTKRGLGTLVLTGGTGTSSVTNNFRTEAGTLLVQGGTWNLPGGTPTDGQWFAVSGGATYLQTGGTVNAPFYAEFSRGGSAGVSTGIWSGGTFTEPGEFMVGRHNEALLIVTNTAVLDLNQLKLGEFAGYTTTCNLDGGVVACNLVGTRGASANSILNLNGGVLRAKSNQGAFINGLTTTAVSARGAVIDSQGFSVTIPQILTKDVNLLTPDGGLTKLGSGTLTLSAANTYDGPTVVSNGTLAVSTTGSILSGDVFVYGTLSAGGGGIPSTLTLSNVTCASGSTLAFDLANDLTVGSGINDLIVLTNLTVTGPTTLSINLLNSLPAAGRYVLIQYSGAVSGTGNLVLGGALVSGSRANASLDFSVAGEIGLVVGTVAGPGSLQWVGDGTANLWNLQTASNWFNTGTAQTDAFFQADNVTFNDSGSNTPAIGLVGALQPGSVTINSTNAYTFAGTGKLTGPGSLTKTNLGTLIIANNNDYSGVTTLGVPGTNTLVQVGTGGTAGSLGTGNLAVYGGNILAYNRSDTVTLPNQIQSANAAAFTLRQDGPGTLVLTGGADNAYASGLINTGSVVLAKTSSSSVHALGSASTVNSGATLRLGGSGGDQIYDGVVLTVNGTYDVAGLTETVGGLSGSGLVSSSVATNLVVTVGGANASGSFAGMLQNGAGTVALTKTGTGTQTFTGTNSFSGAVTIGGGVLAVTNDAALGAIPASPVTNVTFTAASTLRFLGSTTVHSNRLFNLSAGNATFDVQANTVTVPGSIKGAGGLVKPNSAGTLILTGTNAYTGATTVSDAQGVASALRVATSQALGTGAISIGSGGNSDQSRIELTGGITIANTFNAWTSRNNTAPNILNVSGVNTVNSAISGGSGGGQSTLQSDAGKLIMKGASTTRQLNLQGAGDGDYQGALNMNGYGLVKSGAGTWTLSATNTYTGTTVINAGTLVVNGVVPTNAVNVVGGSLAGTGVLRGATTVQTNATLAPGSAGIGTLAISNVLTLAAGSTLALELARNGAALTNDLVRGLTTITNGGTLFVTNIGASPLQVGDTFKLVSATTYVGTFAKSILPAGYSWNNRVAVDGTLTVLSVVNPVITGLTLSPDGTALTLRGSNGLWGGTYTVLASTNAAAPLATWAAVTNGTFDASGRFSQVVTNVPAPAARFFRVLIP